MAVPDFFTVEEAARILRIGRTAAYQAAKEYRATGGAEGLPVVTIRGSLRVPRQRLEVMAGGPISADGAAPVTDLATRRGSGTDASTGSGRPRRAASPKRLSSRNSQSSLPFTG